MTRGLVLELFPGLGVLGMGFEAEGWTVVRGPDVLWGGDVRDFHVPAGRFDLVIGGPPCQAFSGLANLVRAKGLEPKFGNLIPDFVRVVEEACPAAFLMENVPKAPDPKPLGYDVRTFLLDHSNLDAGNGEGHEQMRKRRFWFGVRDGMAPDLRQWIDFALFQLTDTKVQAVSADARSVPVKLGGSGKVKTTAVCGGAGSGDTDNPKYRRIPNRGIAEMLRLQGLPENYFDEGGPCEHSPFTMQANRKLVGNAVPLPMAKALARAVGEAVA